MGQVQFDPKTQEVTITYGGEAVPWSGIDSSQPDNAISPAGLVFNNLQLGSSQNGIVIDNSLRALCWQPAQYFSVSPYIFIGMGDLLGQVFFVYYSVSAQTVLVSSVVPFPGGTPTPIGQVVLPNYVDINGCPNAPSPGTLTFKNINGVCFFSWPGLPYILQHNNQALSILTSYLGASYLNELNGVLLAMDVWQFVAQSTSSGGGTTIAPAPTGGSASASFSGNGSLGSNTVYSTPISLFAATSVAAGTSIELTCDISGTANIYQAGITWMLQYSINSGITWNTWIYTGTTGGSSSQSFAQPGTQTTIPGTAGVTNLNQIWIRCGTIASAGANGSSSGQTIYSNLSANYTAPLPPGICSASYVQRYPYQFAWSAPQGQYGQFNPLVNGLQTGAGYNNLPDVEDTITGYFNVGPTGYIIRTQGITEVSPLNSGLAPFDFNHMWASHKGIGTIYPQTVAQYGSKGVFLSDVGIFTFGYEGINTIDLKAKSAIYGELILNNSASFICAGCGPIQLDGNNFLAYVITSYSVGGIVTYIFNFTSGEWYRILFNSIYPSPGGMQVSSIQWSYTNTAINSLFLVNYPNGTAIEIAALPLATSITPLINANINGATWIFKAEDVVPGRDITIDGIYVYYKSNTVIANTALPNILLIIYSGVGEGVAVTYVLNPNLGWQFGQGWCYNLLTPANVSPFTGKVPFLAFSMNIAGLNSINFQLGKVILYGSCDTEQRPV